MVVQGEHVAQLRILPVRSDKILEATVMAAVHVVLGRDGIKVCVLGQDGHAICGIIDDDGHRAPLART